MKRERKNSTLTKKKKKRGKKQITIRANTGMASFLRTLLPVDKKMHQLHSRVCLLSGYPWPFSD
jgi:hypothetical protein